MTGNSHLLWTYNWVKVGTVTRWAAEFQEFAAVSRGIWQMAPRNLAKLQRKTVVPSHEQVFFHLSSRSGGRYIKGYIQGDPHCCACSFFYIRTLYIVSLNKQPMGCDGQLAEQLFKWDDLETQ